IFLHFIGGGYYLDQFLGKHVEVYQSRSELEALAWQNPPAGRLVGFARVPDPTDTIPGVIFKDIKDRDWQLMTTDLSEHDVELLRSGRKVRVLIATSSGQAED